MNDVFAKSQALPAPSILCGSGPMCARFGNWQDLKNIYISSHAFARHACMELISADGNSFVKCTLTNGACD